MKFLNNLGIEWRLNAVLSSLMLLIIAGLGVYILVSQYSSYQEETDEFMYADIEDLGRFVSQEAQSFEQKTNLKPEDFRALKPIFRAKKYYTDGYPYLISSKGLCLIHPNAEGQNVSSEEFFQQIVRSGKREGKTFYNWKGEKKRQYFEYISEIDSYVAVTVYEKNLMAKMNRTRNAILIALILSVGIFAVVNGLLSRSIITGLKQSIEFAQHMAEGDLTHKIKVEQKDEVGQLVEALNTMQDKMRNAITDVHLRADDISSTGRQMTETSQSIAQGANEQAASTQEISASMEEMVANIQQSSDNAQQTEKATLSVSENMEKVGTASKQSNEAINEIAGKISIIGDIAFQTNILALNAAVEAARAGEHGKGFAVVAAEVRKLAERSKLAAEEIDVLSKKSVEATGRAGNLTNELLPQIKQSSGLIQEISANGIEQNSGANQINNAVQELNNITQQNAAASEELASSSSELSGHADRLKDIVSFFKVNENGKKTSRAIKKEEFSGKPSKPKTEKVKMEIMPIAKKEVAKPKPSAKEKPLKEFKEEKTLETAPKENPQSGVKSFTFDMSDDVSDSDFEKM